MTQQSVIERSRLLKWLCQPRRVPLLFAVTVVAGIFYHYASSLTVLWIALSLLMQGLLFKLFDFVKKHNVIGGAAYVAVGMVFLVSALALMRAGEYSPIFAPDNPEYRIDFFVWFMTPQSVLVTKYVGFTMALFLLFTFFISSVTYYFTFVRYRVLMSFMVMLFPFAIYAKENETMPVPSIIILLVCYFAVMIYCRQAHAEDSEVVQIYQPNAESTLTAPGKKSALADVKPELLDGKFLRASGIFLAAASILVLIIPKPAVEADRTLLDTMLDLSTLTTYLENAIAGFADTSDGGKYNNINYKRTLYYANGGEPLNLRTNTYTDYRYSTDDWAVSDYDRKPNSDDPAYHLEPDSNSLKTVMNEPDPIWLISAVRDAAQSDAAFAAAYGLTNFDVSDAILKDYRKHVTLEAATPRASIFIYPSPLHTIDVLPDNRLGPGAWLFQNRSGIVFRYEQNRYPYEKFVFDYTSERLADLTSVSNLLSSIDKNTYNDMLLDMQQMSDVLSEDEQHAVFQALSSYEDALEYADSVHSQTPARVKELAESLTAGLTSDYDKAYAIRDYLKFGDFVYDLEYPIQPGDNVETFLFQNKTGVCYQFASAMTELCRAVGIPTRYVEGYAMMTPDNRLMTGESWDFAITTDEAHAFVDVYIPCYGWLMMDATTGTVLEHNKKLHVNIIATLQYSGIFLFCVAILLIVVLAWLVPMLREKLFRRKYMQKRDAAAVQAAFARLRKQWNADPASTARELCAEQGAFLQTDLSELCSGVEETLYANRCSAETADRVFRVYCAAYDAWKPACRRQQKEKRAARKAAKKHTAAV